jgi:hypothetical protein
MVAVGVEPNQRTESRGEVVEKIEFVVPGEFGR